MRATTNYIKREDLTMDTWYDCEGRNLGRGRWNGNGFVYLRSKFGMKYPDMEYHWDDGAPYGTCKPIKQIEPPAELAEIISGERYEEFRKRKNRLRNS